MEGSFEWAEQKNQENQLKHGVSFEEAEYAFADINRLILRDKNIAHRKKLASFASVK